ncbi:MAG: hypothetical protein E7031_09120 [Akkermansiaceae bacterium]|nr:hypothetical protein [Akkermansiaceae bacterium]
MNTESRKIEEAAEKPGKAMPVKPTSLGLSGVLIILLLFLGGGYTLYQMVQKIPDDMTFIDASDFDAKEDPYVKSNRPTDFVHWRPRLHPNVKTIRKQPSIENEIQEEASASAPTAPVIVSTSTTAMPMSVPTSIADMGEGLSLGDGFGGGDLDEGLGGDGLGSKDGGGSTLEGTFYDLKLKRNGASSGLKGDPQGEAAVVEALAKFFRSWSEQELNKYYKSETKLYASCWYLPITLAKYAPIAYEVGDPTKPESQWESKPSAWLAVYRGRVIAPKTGKFRFIGTGDDLLAVRFNGETVLEAGYFAPSYYDKTNPTGCYIAEPVKRERFLKNRKEYEMITGIRGCDKWDKEIGGLVAGKEFNVEEGEVYNIEIAVADITGDSVGFVLFIEDVTYGKSVRARQYDLFRTCDTNPDYDKVMQAIKEAKCGSPAAKRIPFNEDSWVWESVPED